MKKEVHPLPKAPFSVGDRAAFIRKATVAVELIQVPTYLVVAYNITHDRVETLHVPASRIATDSNTPEQYYVDGDHVSGGVPAMTKTHLSWLRSNALERGATPDAIRLLEKATGRFSKKEVASMAEKLKAKSTRAKPATDELKAAAKSTPVAKGGKPKGEAAAAEAPKRKGNADALAKARAARQSGPDTRKIKALIKPKDIAAREGSYRHTMLTDLLASKTVQEFREKNEKYSAGDLRYAIGANIVSVSEK